jgi:hypothetical protein
LMSRINPRRKGQKAIQYRAFSHVVAGALDQTRY